MKTTAMEHQLIGCDLLAANPEYYALACEQGTGKTWMLLADIERQFLDGRIEAALVVAPKGVHTNWVRREIPKHMDVRVLAGAYSSGMGKKAQRKFNRLFELDQMRDTLIVMTINIDALNTKKGYDAALRFLKRYRCWMGVDESQRIKNPGAGRTKKVHTLGEFAVSRRIASGTILTNGPLDAFGQYQFLRNGLLGTTSYRTFVSEFAEVLPEDSPLVEHARERSRGRGNPQIIARDRLGRPKFRNLEKLSALMAPYTYRVLKRDCLDLPEKIYKTHFFDLTPAQRKVYDEVKEQMRFERDDGEIDIYTALTMINKLRQITSGFIMVDGEATGLIEDNPRTKALMEALEDVDGKAIIWATFREEIAQICAALRKKGHEVVEYHGGVKETDREAAIDAFQNGSAEFFVGNAQSGGTGLTLTAAETAIYYSIDFSLEQRLQSEDRCHRIGTKANVVYIDLAAVDTIDERIAMALQSKNEVATQVLDGM